MKKSRLFLFGLLLLYWLISLNHLESVPQVYQDEPWIASTAWKMVVDGRFGSDMFAGLYGMSQHYYAHLPLYPLLLAGTYTLLGLSLWVSRFTAVVMGLVTLSLTYSLGRRLWGQEVGLLAVLYLLFIRTTGATFIQLSGILLWDLARIARYDMLVPIFGLLALHLYYTTDTKPSGRFYFLIGMLVACAGLSHIYGNFWLIVILLLGVWQRRGWPFVVWLLAGFTLVWLPYLFYIWQGWADWLAQINYHNDKLQLGQPAWYLSNLLLEYQRYGPGIDEADWGFWTRPGFWTTVLLLPMAVIRLVQTAVREKNQAAQTVLVPLLVIPFLFALLITPKASRYLATVMPLVAVALAWVARQIWQWVRRQKGTYWLRWVMLVWALAILFEGSRRIYLWPVAASTTTSYTTFMAEIRQEITADSHVLAIHDYWFGLQDLRLTAWVVPLQLAREESLTAALTAVNPDVIIWDMPTEEYFQQHPQLSQEVNGWLEAQGFVTAVTLHDPTYNTVQILARDGSQSQPP